MTRLFCTYAANTVSNIADFSLSSSSLLPLSSPLSEQISTSSDSLHLPFVAPSLTLAPSPPHPLSKRRASHNNSTQQQMMEKKLYEMAKSMEDALDDELHKMNNMDTDDLENIRRKRMEAMKGDQDKRKKWLAAGHGRAPTLGGADPRPALACDADAGMGTTQCRSCVLPMCLRAMMVAPCQDLGA